MPVRSLRRTRVLALLSTAFTGLVTGLGASAACAQAVLPSGGAVVAGQAGIASNGTTTTVTQATDRAVIDWRGFDVAAGHGVVFAQPGSGSATLNRVTGTSASTIAGSITSNGAVYLVNPNGIAITSTGVVQTGGGFVASTLDIADADFMGGKLAFAGTGGSVSNAGRISAGSGAYVALLGGAVANDGVISVPAGKVALGAGTRATLDLNGDGFLQIAVPAGVTGGTAPANGRVQVTAAGLRDALRNMVNMPLDEVAVSAMQTRGGILLGGMPRSQVAWAQVARGIAPAPAAVPTSRISMSGTIDVGSATGDAGRIALIAAGGTASVTGTLSARATGASGDGGTVETSGATVDFTGATIDTRAANGATGTWLVDPTDLTVDAAAAATISANLATSNVTLQTTATTASGPGNQASGNGDINITAAISWSTANTLSLLAYNNISLSGGIIAPAGGLMLTAGNGVANTGLLSSNAINIGVFNLTNGNWSQNFSTLPAFTATDFQINLASASFLRVTGGTGANGSAFTIGDVYGLQGMASSTLLGKYFQLTNSFDASTTATWNAGAGFVPIGTDGTGKVWNGTAFATNGSTGYGGSLNGGGFFVSNLTINRPTSNNVGLIGYFNAQSGSISKIGVVGGTVTGQNYVGGLIGYSLAGSITNTYATDAVFGGSYLGGLVGYQGSGGISNSYATGAVTGPITKNSRDVGGLVGDQYYGAITNSYATGAVTGAGYIGGLVGAQEEAGPSITNAYATGAVTGGGYVGGLVGDAEGPISNTYASGLVTGHLEVGGLTGENGGSYRVTESFWDKTTSGQTRGTGQGDDSEMTGLTTAQARTAGGYQNFDFTNTWFQVGDMRPILRSEAAAAVNQIVTVSNLHQLALINASPSGSYQLSADIDATATSGSNASGVWGTGGFVPLGTDGASNVWDGTKFAAGGTYGFYGFLNGLGFVINNLTINRPTAYYVGLFGYSEGTIKNLGVAGGTVKGRGDVGGLVGYQADGGGATISNVYASDAVTGTYYVGGLIGVHMAGAVSNAYALGAVSGSIVGGLVGGQSGGGVSNAYASGAVSGSGAYGGLFGTDTAGTLTNLFWDTQTTGQTYAFGTGPTTGTTGLTTAQARTSAGYAGFDFSNTWFQGGDMRPLLRSESGTSVNSGVIVTVDNLHQLALMGVSPGRSYQLTANIDATATSGANPSDIWSTGGWVPLGTDGAGNVWNSTTKAYDAMGTTGFSGTLNGGGYTIANLTVARPGVLDTGLLGWTTGTIKNLTMTGAAVTGGNNVGALTGYLYKGSVSSVTIGGTTSGTSNVGGVVGLEYQASVLNSASSGAVSGTSNIGGLVGYEQSSTITGSSSAASATASKAYAGGLVGYQLNGTVNTFVSASGAVSAPNAAGGLSGIAVGFANPADSNTTAVISAASATGTVTGTSGTGGLVGFLGYNASVGQVYATGAVNGVTNVGGLIGYQYISSVADGYATGAVSGTTNVGGLIGTFDGATATVARTYATGAVTGSSTTGGLIANLINGATVTASVWDTQTTGQAASAGGTGATGYTTGQLEDATNTAAVYPGWDFTNIWLPPNQAGQNGATAHYPRLRARPTP